jgi:hypothetical protein
MSTIYDKVKLIAQLMQNDEIDECLVKANEFSKTCYRYSLDGKLSDAQYKAAFDKLESKCPRIVNYCANSIEKNYRTLGDFALNVKIYTQEQLAALNKSLDATSWYPFPWTVENNGVDNSGCVIFLKDKNALCVLDYLINGTPTDIKINRANAKKNTQKLRDINKIGRYPNMEIWTIGGDQSKDLYVARMKSYHIENIRNKVENEWRYEVRGKAYQFYVAYDKKHDYGLTENDRIGEVAKRRLSPRAVPLQDYAEIFWL